METENQLKKCEDTLIKQVLEALSAEDKAVLNLSGTDNYDLRFRSLTLVEQKQLLPRPDEEDEDYQAMIQNALNSQENNNVEQNKQEQTELKSQQTGQKFNDDPWHHDNFNLLYHQLPAPYLVNQKGLTLKLVGVHFAFLTRDQGWASAQDSSSWIEASFVKQNQLQLDTSQIERKTLATNYCVEEFELKTALITDQNILKDLVQINVYLRSQYPGWRTYCNKSQITLVYA